MGNIVENPVWEPSVFQVEVTTPLLGGSPENSQSGNPTSGFLNVAQQQLANRTQYLKEALESTDIDVGGLSDTLTAHIGSRGAAHTNATQTEAGFMSATDKTKLNGVETGAQVNVATNLTQGTRTTTTVPITSSTGTSAMLDVATTLLAGVMSSTDKTKLDGIAAGAEVNTVTSVATKTGAVTLVKADVGLANVDNTADTAKPVSIAQQTALNLKADLASPALTGTPTAPTAAPGTNTTQLATTAFVLANAPSSTQPLIHVQDQKTSGTGGGTPNTGGATARAFNTTIVNQISGASLASNVITLPAGNYYTEGFSTFSGTALYRIQIYNSTDATAILEGLSIAGSGNISITSFAGGYFSLASTKAIGLFYQASSGPVNGLGFPASRGIEVYSDLKIWKLP